MSQILLLVLQLACSPCLVADEPIAAGALPVEGLRQEQVRAAIQKAVPPLQHGSSTSAAERKCFTCHNQAVPVIALCEIAQRGFDVDQGNLQVQLQHTWNHLHNGKEAYASGSGQGGQVMTAGYAMWTLEAGGWKADETTAAVSHYLVEYQRDKGRWLSSSQRLPSAGSAFTATYVALRALAHFGTDDQTNSVKARREAAAKWIVETEPHDMEDRVFQLRAIPYLDAADEFAQKAVEALLTRQRADSGWSQAEEMESDAYATSTVLVALQESGHLPADHPAIVSGCRYLIDSQLADGTWHVVTHAKPIQEYYESGFPHSKDQFISITATGWATLALAHTLPAAASK